MSAKKEIPYIDSRLFKILIMCSEKQICSIASISEELNVTSRSVRTYIKQLNDELGDKVASIEYIKGLGYKLKIYNKDILDKIIDKNKAGKLSLNSRQDRIKYILNYLINLDGTITLDDLAEKMSIGRTTLVNDFKIVKDILKSYNLKLINKQNRGMKLIEDELNIRLLIINYLYKDSNSNFRKSKYFTYMDKNIINEIKKILYGIFNENNYHTTDEAIEQTINYISLMLHRHYKGKKIITYDKKFQFILSYHEYNIAEKILIEFEKYFKIMINREEQVYLTLPLVSGNAPISANNIIDKKLDKNMNELVDNIFNEINEKTGILIEDDELRLGLVQHLRFMLNRLLFNIVQKNVLLDEIKEKYILSYNISVIAASVIEKNYNVIVSDDDIGFIALHFGSYLERSNDKFQKLNKIALICGTGLGTSKLLNIRLRKMFGDEIIINNFSSINLTCHNFDEYDLILTTIDVKLDTTSLVLKIDTIFDEKKLRGQIERLIHLDPSKVDVSVPINLITQIVSDPNQVVFLENDNIMDCLNIMLDNLIQFGYVDKGFKERVINRELQTPTSFDSGIMLPHSFCDTLDYINLSIGILKQPVTYNKRKIKIILLMMMPDEGKMDPSLLVKIYDEILRIGQNQKLIDKLSKCKDLNDIRNLLFDISI